MTWAFKRQFLYVVILLVFFLGLGYLIISPSFNQAPTCFDNRQNGAETGIDCGGSCVKACTATVDQISILWSRAFEVVPGRYNAVSYLENSNKNTAIIKIKYRFRFADKNNIYIGKREGETYVPPSGKFAVFEPAIDVGNSIPVYTTFEFTEAPTWITVDQNKIDQFKVLTSDLKLENETSLPRFSATIKNNSLFPIPGISVVAILYDQTGNAISASNTYVDVLNGEASKQVIFTWREIFPEKVFTEEIIPMFNIFDVKLR